MLGRIPAATQDAAELVRGWDPLKFAEIAASQSLTDMLVYSETMKKLYTPLQVAYEKTKLSGDKLRADAVEMAIAFSSYADDFKAVHGLEFGSELYTASIRLKANANAILRSGGTTAWRV